MQRPAHTYATPSTSQVEKLALRTFVQRDWQVPGALSGVPLAFVAGVLLPSTARDFHYPRSATGFSGLTAEHAVASAGTVSGPAFDVQVRLHVHLCTVVSFPRISPCGGGELAVSCDIRGARACARHTRAQARTHTRAHRRAYTQAARSFAGQARVTNEALEAFVGHTYELLRAPFTAP